MGRDEVVLQPHGVAAVAGPGERAGILDHAGPHRIHLDVLMADQEIALRLDGARLEAPLPKGARALVEIVEVADVAPTHALHHLAEGILRGRAAEHVNVVRHQDVRMHRDFASARRIDHAAMEEHAVAFRAENRLPVIASHPKMGRDLGGEETRKSSHGGNDATAAAWTGRKILEKLYWSLTPFILAGCSLIDPHNMIGRQGGDSTHVATE